MQKHLSFGVNLKRAIRNIGEVHFYQPLYESIVNSFQANANEVKISFNRDNLDNVKSYTVEDNGDGFTDDNINSFLELWSDYKASVGGLGSGRILCLKVFNNINIESQIKERKVIINFNSDFKANNKEYLNITDSNLDTTATITKFEKLNDDFISESKLEKYDLDKIKENIFIKLLPMFIRFQTENKKFKIYIDNTLWLDYTILEKKFKELEFQNSSFSIEKDLSKFDKSLNSKELVKYDFKLYYRLKKDEKNELQQFYGASDRNITEFPNAVKIEKLEKGWSAIFCLTSNYFEENRVTDARNKFVIGLGDNNSASIENPITFPEINHKLAKLIEEILKDKFPKLENSFKENQNKVIDKFPHLLRYIKRIDNLTWTESQIQKKAENEFFKETKRVRAEVENFTLELKKGKSKFDDKKLKEITAHFTQTGVEQLADYTGYRQTIIDMLLEIYNKNSNIAEKEIHNLFMPMGETSDTLSYHANNIWIFDDKFMSYSYSASDKTIAKIVKDVTGKDRESIDRSQRDKEPDLVMFYSDAKEKYKDVLLIEFKKLNGTIDDKEKAISQINRYPRYIDENIDNIRSIYTYTILDIDKELEDGLTKEHGFVENSFGDSENKVSAYYKYNPAVKAHINVISFIQIIQDSNKRNKVFLDILKENFKDN